MAQIDKPPSQAPVPAHSTLQRTDQVLLFRNPRTHPSFALDSLFLGSNLDALFWHDIHVAPAPIEASKNPLTVEPLTDTHRAEFTTFTDMLHRCARTLSIQEPVTFGSSETPLRSFDVQIIPDPTHSPSRMIYAVNATKESDLCLIDRDGSQEPLIGAHALLPGTRLSITRFSPPLIFMLPLIPYDRSDIHPLEERPLILAGVGIESPVVQSLHTRMGPLAMATYKGWGEQARIENEDGAFAFLKQYQHCVELDLAVIDAMGGEAAGVKITEVATDAGSYSSMLEGSTHDSIEWISRALRVQGYQVLSQPGDKQGGLAITAVRVSSFYDSTTGGTEGILDWAHVGDTRGEVWRAQEGTFNCYCRTEDRNEYADRRRVFIQNFHKLLGRPPTDEEIASVGNFGASHVITNAIGVFREMGFSEHPAFISLGFSIEGATAQECLGSHSRYFPIQRDDTVILGSDGFWHNITQQDKIDALRQATVSETLNYLLSKVEQALLTGTLSDGTSLAIEDKRTGELHIPSDNVTALVLRFEPEPRHYHRK